MHILHDRYWTQCTPYITSWQACSSHKAHWEKKEKNALVYSEDSCSQKRKPCSRTSLAEVRSDSAQRDHETERKKKDAVIGLVLKTKTDYLNAQIVESQTCKQLFSVTNSLLGKSKVSPLPNNIQTAQLPHSFCEFFTEKIKQIRRTLDNTPFTHVPTVVPDIATPLVQFSSVSEKEVHNILKKIAQTTREFDPLSTSLLYENIDLLLPALTNIINRSLLSGEVPSEFKTAVVKPLLKQASLDPKQMKNYRPVSNLPFLSKIPKKGCPDAANKLSDLKPTHTQISIYLPCWSQYRNSSPSYCQWHAHSFWCQPSFYPDSPWFVGCVSHHWPLHTVAPSWATTWCFWSGRQLVSVIPVKQFSVCFRKQQ